MRVLEGVDDPGGRGHLEADLVALEVDAEQHGSTLHLQGGRRRVQELRKYVAMSGYWECNAGFD